MGTLYQTTTEFKATANNPLGVLKSGIGQLNIGPKRYTTVQRSSLVHLYDGPLSPRQEFMDGIHDMFHESTFQKAFDNCKDDALEMNDQMQEKYPYWTLWNKVQVGAEITMSWEFIKNVTCPVARILDALHKPTRDVPPRRRPKIPESFTHGDHWISPKRFDGFEPDLIFLIPESGSNEELNRTVRIIGELKSPSTVVISSNSNQSDSRAEHSLRHIIGQSVKDMLQYRVRYGFASTYDDTVFLKLGKEHGKWTVFYSPVIKRADELAPLVPNEKIKTTSVRAGLLFLLQQVVYQDSVDSWKLLEDVGLTKYVWRYEHYTKLVTKVNTKIGNSRGALTDKSVSELTDLFEKSVSLDNKHSGSIPQALPGPPPTDTTLQHATGSAAPTQSALRRSERNQNQRQIYIPPHQRRIVRPGTPPPSYLVDNWRTPKKSGGGDS